MIKSSYFLKNLSKYEFRDRISQKANKFFIKNSATLSKEKSKELIIKSVKKILQNEDINVDVKQLSEYYLNLLTVK